MLRHIRSCKCGDCGRLTQSAASLTGATVSQALRNPATTHKSDHDQHAHYAGDATSRFLVQHWIQDPPREDWLIASLCFFSNIAMAKLTHCMMTGKPWPANMDKVELEKKAGSIKKVYQRLGLLPARPRLIRDFTFKFGKPDFILFKRATRKGN